MKPTLIRRALLFAAASLAIAPAGAQTHSKHRIDTNGDGVVDFSELQVLHPDLTVEEFNKMDTNSDGQLVREELFAAHFEKRLARADSDGDGALSFEEMEAFHRRPDAERFSQFDTDGDGKLTREELAAMHKKIRENMPALTKFRHASDEDEAARTK